MESLTSMVHDRRHGGSMYVHKPAPLEELISDGETHARAVSMCDSHNSPTRSGSSRRAFSTPNPRLRARNTVDPETLLHHSLKLQEWLNERSVKAVQEKSDTEAKSTKKLYESVLDTENSFVKDMQGFVQQNQTHGVRKKEILHKKWNENVFQPVRKQIDKEMNGPLFTELDRRKRALYRDYLEHVNKKGHVFLDTIAPAEYFPMALHPVRPSFLTAETKQLRDPLLSQGKERSKEDRLMFRCMTGSTLTEREMDQVNLPRLPLVPLGRHGTECRTWLAMPMGDIESPVRQSSRRRMHPQYNDAHFSFSTWGQPCSQSVVEAEMAIQKRKSYHPELEIIDFEKTPRMPQEANVAVQCE